jgi:1,4-dihydroxy-2-naphthoyl-CoA hydrolase
MPKLFKQEITVASLSDMNQNAISHHIGIEYIEIGDDYLVAKMPVDHRTKQPFGLLHGGASVVLAEDMGSLASMLCLDPNENKVPVGLEINANHVKGARSGWVYGRVSPIHIGKTTHLWQIRISDEKEQLVCICRLTVMIIDRK